MGAQVDRWRPKVPGAFAGKGPLCGQRHHGLPHHNPNTLMGKIELRDSASGIEQFEAHPRQHVEDDADRQNKLRCDTEEGTDEDLRCQYSKGSRSECVARNHQSNRQAHDALIAFMPMNPLLARCASVTTIAHSCGPAARYFCTTSAGAESVKTSGNISLISLWSTPRVPALREFPNSSTKTVEPSK